MKAQPTTKTSQFKGSALKRLKHNLNNAGIIGQPKTKKSNKSKSARPSALKLRSEAIIASLRTNNPFESKTQHNKHDVLGRKLKGAFGRPGLTRQKGLETRKAAIMSDLAKQNRVGGVVDRRIGENDPNMTEEEKMMLRWTREKQRIAKDKGSMYNLDDNVGSEFEGLTHLGRPVNEMDEFGDGVPMSDDEMDGDLSRQYSRAMFGGGAGDHKSKAEVMQELIAKSKQHKAERQLIHRENEDLRLQLDSDLTMIQDLLIAGSHKSVKANEKSIPDDDYDLMVRQLKFDKRAAPTDRTKTEEELAAEEKQRLEAMESDRIRRMNGDELDSDPDIGGGGGYKARRERLKRVSVREPSAGSDASDGSDAESDDDRFGNKVKKTSSSLTYSADGQTIASKSIFVKKNNKPARDSELDSDLDASEDEDVSDGEGDTFSDILSHDENSDNSMEGSKSESDADSSSMSQDTSASTQRHVNTYPATVMSESERTAMMLRAQAELPYTFEAPASQEKFDQLMLGRTPSQVAELITRLRKLYHPSFSQDNKAKQADNLGFLMHYMWNFGEHIAAHEVLYAFNILYPVIVEMAQAYPIAMAQWASDMLGSLAGPTRSVPTDFAPARLFCFKLLCNIFSVSDFHHAVVTPLLLMISCYLSRPPKSVVEAATGLFLTELCLEIQSVSKRWIPEVFNYINHLISIYSSSKRGLFPIIDSFCAGSLSMPPEPLKLGPSNSPSVGNSHSSILFVCLKQLEHFDMLYFKSVDSLPELFEPVIDILEHLPPIMVEAAKDAKDKDLMHADLIAMRTKVLESMRKHSQGSCQTRIAIQLQKSKPKPIAQFDPLFDDSYNLDRKYMDDPHADVETEKVKAQYKKERKGAIRELRRDAEFLATVRIKEQRQKDQAYESKMRRIEGTLGDEIGELKKLKRDSKRRKL